MVIMYCRPDENSLTAKRARDGEMKLRQEVCDLCNVIFEMGQVIHDQTTPGRAQITFGKLFKVRIGCPTKFSIQNAGVFRFDIGTCCTGEKKVVEFSLMTLHAHCT